jgi:hypothetical protein
MHPLITYFYINHFIANVHKIDKTQWSRLWDKKHTLVIKYGELNDHQIINLLVLSGNYND